MKAILQRIKRTAMVAWCTRLARSLKATGRTMFRVHQLHLSLSPIRCTHFSLFETMSDGSGVMQYPSGAKYSGGWKEGKRHAKGDMIYANGDVYKGNWADNLPNGQGNFTGSNGAQYSGGWKDGKVCYNKLSSYIRIIPYMG